MATITTHTEQMTRLKRIEGQIRGIQRMIEEERYCIDILTQLQATEAAIKHVQANILKKHLQECVATAMRTGSEREQDEKLDEIIGLLLRFKT
ncbi:MAG: metal-sensitive transcriptional regulator [Candidatus Abyssubacteria bacterium]